MLGNLFVVATPIGNLDDITLRAVNVLRGVQTIAAEDTRRTGTLLAHLGIVGTRLIALHDHNERAALARVLEVLRDGADAALVSDAGTPLISDPGFNLVSACHAEGMTVLPIPGASSVMAALSVCPIPAARFCFEGFLPAKTAARNDSVRRILGSATTTVFFEAPHRIEATLEAIATQDAGRELMIGREMTKKFEDYRCGTAKELLAGLRARDAVRGEFVCVLAPASADGGVTEEAERVLSVLVREVGPSKAARMTAQICGGNRSTYYDRAAVLSRT
ncbi:MAG: 16S rRNA (cytidine(1402)-2'-O)-methyltransferase [Pseudomonadales bacterium]|jgi:16S rRNA (cytidine1402-2'-O)-methyltransferase|nr:16S rRNA (cytidine(1402)-2'-O)-methyltransferase [Pseudomonadales bacterium]MDP6470872.1 16S rRNA (cytidine(1402)-2'-O)-methyltransferase [Pseudomonadales bacterium]MDP6825943.1 16S rRNA (cytidine(1402)-2'-O)-methyltransferase [Pseudomonadales bacterium]MDP6972255.1 16S rRNA (cytidine(1402)-2'-O)-methyltransferase [Pseudomonadales bacterium]|tara:strand:+ start:1823 stop:2653 length:831 start_codon:yes stop_codon:yes gene_type:complete